jgi:fibronectin-binding autotransporter adhesin
VVIGAGNARLDGFTVRGGVANGVSPHDQGAGIYCISNGSLVIANNRIIGNQANSNGGAVYAQGSCALEIRNNTIAGNRAYQGAALWAATNPTALVLEGNVITANTITGGGYVLFAASAAAVVKGNLLVGNPTPFMTMYAGGGTITNNVVWGDAQGGGSVLQVDSATHVISNTISRGSGDGIRLGTYSGRLANNIVSGLSGIGVYEGSSSSNPATVAHSLQLGRAAPGQPTPLSRPPPIRRR